MKIVMQDILQSIQKKLWNSHKDLPFLPEKKKLEKLEKFVMD